MEEQNHLMEIKVTEPPSRLQIPIFPPQESPRGPVPRLSSKKIDGSFNEHVNSQMSQIRFTRQLNKLWRSQSRMEEGSSTQSRREAVRRKSIDSVDRRNLESLGQQRHNQRHILSTTRLRGNITKSLGEYLPASKGEVSPKHPHFHRQLVETIMDVDNEVHNCESLTGIEDSIYLTDRFPKFCRQISQLSHAEGVKEDAIRLRQLKKYQKCVVLPDDGWFVWWSIFLVLAILVAGVFTPLRVAFLDNSDGQGWWVFVLEGALDIVFLADILLSLITAYFDSSESLVDSRKRIACNYLKSWFLVDVVSVLPLRVLGVRHAVTQMAKLARVHRVQRIIRTFKLLRMLKVRGGERESGAECGQYAFFLIIFLVLCHNLACLWFWVARLEGLGSGSWVARFDLADAAAEAQYVASFYFIVATITTVGYGDFNGGTEAERLFCCVLMLIGVVAYSMSISALSQLISERRRRAQDLRQRLGVLDRIRRRYRLKFEFYWRLRQALHYDLERDAADQQELLAQLPNKLKVELSTLMYREALAGIQFFQKKSPHFVASVAPCLRPVSLTKGEFVYMAGDPIDAIYFIKSGEAAYVQPKSSNQDLVFALDNTGSFFGHVDFALSSPDAEARRAFSVKARTNMELLVLQKSDLFDIDAHFKSEILELFAHSKETYLSLLQFHERAQEQYKKANPDAQISEAEQEQEYSSQDSDSQNRSSQFALIPSKPVKQFIQEVSTAQREQMEQEFARKGSALPSVSHQQRRKSNRKSRFNNQLKRRNTLANPYNDLSLRQGLSKVSNQLQIMAKKLADLDLPAQHNTPPPRASSIDSAHPTARRERLQAQEAWCPSISPEERQRDEYRGFLMRVLSR